MPDSSLPTILLQRGGATPSVPISFATAATWSELRAGLEPRAGRSLLMPGPDGALAGVLFGLEAADDPAKDLLRPGALPALLPAGAYRFANAPHDPRLGALAFALGCYRFARYRKPDDKQFRLEVPAGIDGVDLARVVGG